MVAASPLSEALGQSEPFLDFQEKISRVAPVDRPVLLVGERGTGKELAAHRLHYLSGRWEGPFVTLNCSTLTPTLIEAELFGYERGAFTGAENRRAGRFESAHGGTLFLDEIGTIPLQAQEKILRVVEYGFFERVGGSQPVEVDVRIVGATNSDLPAMAKQGQFKPDLLDRLSFEVVFLPPLRFRGEDIMLLARHFAGRMAYELGSGHDIVFTAQAVAELEKHPWPGNVRELKNVIERAVYRSDSGRISDISFDPFSSPFPGLSSMTDGEQEDDASGTKDGPTGLKSLPENGEPLPVSFKETVKGLEVDLVQRALARSRYNQKEAAAMLELSYDQLRGLLRKYKKELAAANK